MSLAGPVLLLTGPLWGAIVAWLLKQWTRWAIAAGTLSAWLMGLWLWQRPLTETGEVVTAYGRSLTLTPGLQSLFVLLLFSLGVLFLLSLLWPQGRYFVPASLAALSPMAAALLIRPLILGSLFWLMAAIFLGVVIQSDRAGRTQGAWRYVLLMTLAVALLLVGGWMADTAQTALHEMAGRLLVLAFLIMLAGFPFHIWLQPVVTAVPGLALVVVMGVGQLVLTIFLYDWLDAYAWLSPIPHFQMMVQWSALFTAVLAGVLALTARDLLRLLGSLLLLDTAVSAALLSVPVPGGRETAVLLLVARLVSLVLAAAGSQVFFPHPDAPDAAARWTVLSAFAGAYGFVSLLGFPFTPGFLGRWTAVTLIAGQTGITPWLPIGILLAMGGGILGLWRQVVPKLIRTAAASLEYESPWLSAAAIIALIGLIWLLFKPFFSLVSHF
ncbi:MAG: hypothetical protein P8183_09800 [Anaerolineae bacterium]